MTKRSSPLNARKNSAKPSAARDAAAQRHVLDLANREDCTAAEGVRLAAPPAAASAPAPAPAPVPVAPGAQLPAAIKGGILPAAGPDRAQSLGEAPVDLGSADASMEPPPRAPPAPAPPAPAPPAPPPASAPPPARALAPAPAATAKTGPSFYNW